MRQLQSLKFWGRPMNLSKDGVFWIRITELDLLVRIFPETEKEKSSWLLTEHNSSFASDVASGQIAARNAAEKWLEKRAEKTRILASRRAA